MALELTTDLIRNAYRLFLEREPETEQALKRALSYGSVKALRDAFLSSDEFRDHYAPEPQLTPLDSPSLEIDWRTDNSTGAALLDHVGKTWTRLGREKPHWSVLSSQTFAPENINNTREAFFSSGADDRDALVAVLRRLSLPLDSFNHVFEFGCGLARVTPFLAETFEKVTACDISSTHLEIAREYLRQLKIGNVDLRLATIDDFGIEKPYDLWFSRIVLQHNPPPIIAMILRRAFSELSPGGVAHFQIPTYAVGYRYRISEYLPALRSSGRPDGQVEMHVLPQSAIFEIAAGENCEPLEVWQDYSAGRAPGWVSSVLTFRKRK